MPYDKIIVRGTWSTLQILWEISLAFHNKLELKFQWLSLPLFYRRTLPPLPCPQGHELVGVRDGQKSLVFSFSNSPNIDKTSFADYAFYWEDQMT